ncbi:MAG TPA: carboxypeptidase-like regulatory domain-containing protein [Kofleriaceae bacterium]
MKYLLLLVTACGAASTTGAAVDHREGTVVGIARDKDSGEVIAQAKLHVRAQGHLAPIAITTGKDGAYAIPHLAPGMYSLVGMFANQQVAVENIAVKSGSPTVVDVEFTLGHPEPITIDFGDPKDSEIFRYKHRSTLIEGTISDRGSHERVPGAVVTAIGPGEGPLTPTLQAVSDDQGRYKFDPVPPGIYVVSAYYSVDSHGTIEVRRSDIDVEPHQGVVVPLWVETSR